MIENIPDITAAQTNPNRGVLVFTATIKPTTAPTIIIPSTPRFNTPDFSTTASPIAANKMGVADTIREAIRRAGLILEKSIIYLLLF